MAKAVIAVLTVVMLGAWALFAHSSHVEWSKKYYAVSEEAQTPPSYADVPTYVMGTDATQVLPLTERNPDPGPAAPGEFRAASTHRVEDAALPIVRLALGAIVLLALTMFYATGKEHGAVMSINLAVWATYFTALAHIVTALALPVLYIYEIRNEMEGQFDIGLYAQLMYFGVTVVGALAVMRSLPELSRGSAVAMKRIAWWLLVLALVGLPLYSFWFLPQFVLFGYPGVVYLANLCAFSLLLLAMTRSNFRFD